MVTLALLSARALTLVLTFPVTTPAFKVRVKGEPCFNSITSTFTKRPAAGIRLAVRVRSNLSSALPPADPPVAAAESSILYVTVVKDDVSVVAGRVIESDKGGI